MRSNAYISNCRMPPAQQFFSRAGSDIILETRGGSFARLSRRFARLCTYISSLAVSSSLPLPSPLAARVGITQKFTYEKFLLVARIINRGGGMRESTQECWRRKKFMNAREVRDDENN